MIATKSVPDIAIRREERSSLETKPAVVLQLGTEEIEKLRSSDQLSHLESFGVIDRFRDEGLGEYLEQGDIESSIPEEIKRVEIKSFQGEHEGKRRQKRDLMQNLVGTLGEIQRRLISQEESQETPEMRAVQEILFQKEINGELNLNEEYEPTSMVDLGTIQDLKAELLKWSGAEDYRLNQNAVPILTDFLNAAYKKGYDNIVITNAYRSYDLQDRLHKDDPDHAAYPGHSQHQSGYAVDIYLRMPGVEGWPLTSLPKELVDLAKKFGILQPLGSGDPPHFFIASALYPEAARDLAKSFTGGDLNFAINDVLMSLQQDESMALSLKSGEG